MVTAPAYVTEDVGCQLQPSPQVMPPTTVDLASYKSDDLQDSTVIVRPAPRYSEQVPLRRPPKGQ